MDSTAEMDVTAMIEHNMTTATASRGAVCMICGEENAAGAPACDACGVPASISMEYSPAAPGRTESGTTQRPRLITLIGDAQVGKTVYLGLLLDMLSRRGGELNAVPIGPYSVQLQRRVMEALSNRGFPEPTPIDPRRWPWGHYRVTRAGRRARSFDLVMPDLPGEVLGGEGPPAALAVVRSLLSQSAGTLLLVDASQAAAGVPRCDLGALGLLTCLDNAASDGGEARVRRPLAVVLCKGDCCPTCFLDPAGFARSNLNRLTNMAETRFEHVAYFACSAVGGVIRRETATPQHTFAPPGHTNLVARTSTPVGAAHRTSTPVGSVARASVPAIVEAPLHSAVRGILEPFDWLTQRMPDC